MRTLRPLSGVLVATALLVALSGCSVAVVDGEAGEPSSSSSPDTGADTGRESAEDDASSAASTGAEDSLPAADDAATGADPTREALIASSTRTLRCDGELTLLDDAMATRVEGSCDRLILNTRGSQVVTDDVAFLEVIGDGNVVLSGAVDKLLVNGEGNVVRWTGETPEISDVGSTNVLKAQ
ncbi:hypothetical protein [Microbacterium resistens]